jgi:tetratricopeptide (TPR) repeat protein
MFRILRIAIPFILAFLILGSLSAQTSASASKPDIQTHLAHAQQALAQKQFDIAARDLNSVLALDPRNIEARSNLGVIQFLQGNYAEASENLRAALRLRPSLWKAQAILGMCEKAQGRFDSATTLLEKSVPHLKQDPQLLVRVGLALAELDYQRQDLEKALSVLALLQNADPTNIDVLYVVYRIHTDLAAQARDKVAVIAPNSARMHQILAEHMVNEGDIKGAIAQYREVLRIDPYLPGIHFELGEAILQDSSYEDARREARKEFEAALTLNPQDAKSERMLGGLDMLAGDNEQAMRHYSRAAELNPQDPEAQIGIAKVLASSGEHDKALTHLLTAVRLDPMNALAHYRLAQEYRQLGRTSEADHELATFQELKAAKDRLRSAYAQVFKKEDRASRILNSDIPQ